jgi:hypothetical protein
LKILRGLIPERLDTGKKTFFGTKKLAYLK